MDTISVPLNPTYEDWLHARRLLRRKEKIHYLWDFFAPVTISAGVIASMVQQPIKVSGLIIGGFFILVVIILPPWSRRRRWNKNWNKEQEAMFIDANEEHIGIRYEATTGSGNSYVVWSEIKAFDEDDRVIFFLTKGSVLFIPKKDTFTAELGEIRNLAKRKIAA